VIGSLTAVSRLSWYGHVADIGHAIKKQTDIGMITACIPKGLQCTTARALVKGRTSYRSGNKVRKIVTF